MNYVVEIRPIFIRLNEIVTGNWRLDRTYKIFSNAYKRAFQVSAEQARLTNYPNGEPVYVYTESKILCQD